MNDIWHPFTHLKFAETPVNIISSSGSYYFDEAGNKYIDAISSWWVNIHGHSHPYIAKKIFEQASENAHSIFSGFTHPQAKKLADRILRRLPGNLSKVFFSDDGSTAVEVALKMSLQFFNNYGKKRSKIIAFENGYHGDTFGSMSVGARNVFNQAFEELLFEVIYIPVPNQDNINETLKYLNTEINLSEVAAFIFEPLVQGAGGMVMYESHFLDILIEKMKSFGVICIADEVMTAFGRTGKMFACENLKQQVDIICLSKGLTGGFLPLGLTVCQEFIFERFISDDKTHTFFHGHSYTANPICCAAANASLDLFESEDT
ncbi:MAG: adenosylmethionine--8-amino-7-oxononanoate transaminase, partial [Bacteroidota bacterium]